MTATLLRSLAAGAHAQRAKTAPYARVALNQRPQSHHQENWPAEVLLSAGASRCEFLINGMFAHVIERESGAHRGHDVIGNLMGTALRPDLAAGNRIGKARLGSAQHHRRVHRRDHDWT